METDLSRGLCFVAGVLSCLVSAVLLVGCGRVRDGRIGDYITITKAAHLKRVVETSKDVRLVVFFYDRNVPCTRRYLHPVRTSVSQQQGIRLVGFAVEGKMDTDRVYEVDTLPTLLDFRPNGVFRFEGPSGIESWLVIDKFQQNSTIGDYADRPTRAPEAAIPGPQGKRYEVRIHEDGYVSVDGSRIKRNMLLHTLKKLGANTGTSVDVIPATDTLDGEALKMSRELGDAGYYYASSKVKMARMLTVKKGSSKAKGTVVLRVLGTNDAPVQDEVLCKGHPGRDPSSSGFTFGLRGERSMDLEEGVWTFRAVPTGLRPYFGGTEINVEAGCSVTNLLRVQKLTVGRLQLKVISDAKRPAAEVYVCSSPHDPVAVSDSDTTDAAGRAQIWVSPGQRTLLRFTVPPYGACMPYEQDIFYNEVPAAPMEVVLASKTVSAACRVYFEEDGERSEMTLTNGMPSITFVSLADTKTAMEAWVRDGEFVFYDLARGQYEIRDMRYVFRVWMKTGARDYCATLKPIKRTVFKISDPNDTQRIGPLGFERWPRASAEITGTVLNDEDDHGSIRVKAFRLNAKGKRAKHTYETEVRGDGSFRFKDLRAGLYDLEASVTGGAVALVECVEALPIPLPSVAIHYSSK